MRKSLHLPRELSDITALCLKASQKLVLMRVELKVFLVADVKKLSFKGLTSQCFTKSFERLH